MVCLFGLIFLFCFPYRAIGSNESVECGVGREVAFAEDFVYFVEVAVAVVLESVGFY